MSLISGLMEVILYVEDMNTQVTFYNQKLGIDVNHPKDTKDYSIQMWVTLNTGMCSLALHGGGKRRLGEDAPKIVFRVDDILLAREELTQRGVQLGEVRSAAPDVWVCDGMDPEGNKFSIESH